jgi:hypothetical protein
VAKSSDTFDMLGCGTVQTADAPVLLTARRWVYDKLPEDYLDPKVNKELVDKIYQRVEEEKIVREDR